MSGEVHEAPLVHGAISCSSLHIETLGMNVSATGIDTSIVEGGNLVENRAFSTAIETLKRDEFNFRLTGDFASPTGNFDDHEINTFAQNNATSLHTFSDGLGITVPASGLYSSTFNFETSSDTKERVILLGAGQYLEMTDPQDFQANASFSIDFEWKGTSFDVSSGNMTSNRVALVSTSVSNGNYFGVYALKFDENNYTLTGECSDGINVMTLDLGQWARDTWYKILVSWSSPQDTISVQIEDSRFQLSAPFGGVSQRPFYFGYDSNTTGGGFKYKYVRFHQDVLNAKTVSREPRGRVYLVPERPTVRSCWSADGTVLRTGLCPAIASAHGAHPGPRLATVCPEWLEWARVGPVSCLVPGSSRAHSV